MAAIAGGAALGAVNPLKIVKVASKAYKAVKYVKAATNTKKATKVATAIKAKPKPTVVQQKTVKTVSKPAVVKKTTQAATKKAKQVKAACFTAGTKIYTEKGFKAIENIKPGDYVWSENPETNEKALKKVKKIFVREKDSLIRLAINGEAIETTDEHPFYVEGKGFTAAKELAVGDEVRLEDGSVGIVEGTETVTLDNPVKVYNFEVEDFHTYYVSEQKVLVHNTCAVTAKNVALTSKKNNIVYRALNQKDVKTISQGNGIQAKNPNGSWNLEEHIVNGSNKSSWLNDPYISTTSDINVARGFNAEGDNLGIVAIDLNKVPGVKIKAYESFARMNGKNGVPYHYSVWQQEISVYGHIPQGAIRGFVK